MTTLISRCEACGDPFVDDNRLGRQRRFCDDRCRSRGRRQRAKEDAANRTAQPFAVAVDQVIAASGMTLRQLAAALGALGLNLSPGALSQWRKGHHIPYDSDYIRHRLFALERIAAVPAGSVVRALLQTRGRPRGPLDKIPQPSRLTGERTLEDARALLLARIASIDGSSGRELIHIEQIEHCVISPWRIPDRSDLTLTVVPLVGGIDRYWHIYGHDADNPMTVAELQGCTARTTLSDLPPVRLNSRTRFRVAATELHFGRRLSVGVPYTFSLTMRYDQKGQLPATEFRRVVRSPATRRLEVGISFDPKVLPRELQIGRWESAPANKTPVEAHPIPVDAAGRTEAYVVTNPMPGGYGFVWDWPSDREACPKPSG